MWCSGTTSTGHCPLLADGRCTIYEDRPRTCRTYDCRVFVAAGVEADAAGIAERARRWGFVLPRARRRERQAAVRAAAPFVREHAESLPSEAARREPLAWPCSPSRSTTASGPPRRGPAAQAGLGPRQARAVVDANERLFADG